MTLFLNILKRLSPALPASYQVAIGASAGTLLLYIFSNVRLILGTHNNVPLSILLAACTSVLLANHFVSRKWIQQPLTISFCLAAFWAILNPSLLQNLNSCFHLIPLETIQKPEVSFGLSLLTCLAALGPIFFACYVLLFSKPEQQVSELQTFTLCGLVLSWIACPVVVVPWFGMTTTIVLSTVVGAIAIIVSRWTTDSRKELSATEFTQRINFSTTTILDVLLCICCGAGFLFATHLEELVFTSSTLYGAMLWSGFGLGILAALCSQRLFSLQSRTPISGGLYIGCWLAMLVIGYPVFTNSALSISTWISSTWLIFACRLCFITLMTAPLGFCVGDVISRRTIGNSLNTSTASVLSFTCGFAILLISDVSISTFIISLCVVAISISLIAWCLNRFVFPDQRIHTILGFTGGALAVMCCVMTTRYVPQLAERVLYSGQAFAALRSGVDVQNLPWLDDSRLTAEFETVNSRWSVWKHRSSQLVVKHNGLSTDYISASPDVCPQVISEVCPVLLPLVLHPAADNVLVMGLHGSSLKTCAEFPLQSVTTLESDPRAREVVHLLKQKHVIPDDPTQRFVYGNSLLSLAAKHSATYDIIVCPSPQVLEAGSAGRFLPNYYFNIAKHLSNDGLFSQRVPYYDLGPEAIQTITKSLQSVFPQVIITEPVAGEIVFIASKNDLPIVTEGVVERLQYPQARRVLSQIGWDWSVPLSRGSLSSESLMEFTQKTITPSLQNYQLALTLPVEVSRWGYKSQQTREELAKYGKTLGTFLGDTVLTKDVSERLEDLRLAQKVLTEHPDQFWAYRSVLKQQLKDRPRAKVMTVKHEGVKRGLHPEDQRRKDYLVALGKAATQEHPTREQIEAVSLFATNSDFDPLVNYFVHHEVALLCERAVEPVPNLELYHRLHAIYFAPSQEKSVRDVCRTIRLMTENEALDISDEQRWDHLNGLLEVMKQRWRVRISDTKHASTYEPIDTEKSIEAIEAALVRLDALRTDTLVTSEVWEIRKEVIDDHLLRPLRRHRSNQLASYAIAPIQ